jgi:iron complex transport system permease protein
MGLRPVTLVILIGVLVGIFLLSLAVGSVNIPLEDIVSILMGGEPAKATWTNIILKFRLPKALTATLAGAALAVSGLQMQTIFRNPLAGPFVLGISSGASLGVALMVLTVGTTGSTLLAGLGLLGDFGLVMAASLGAALVLVLVLALASRVHTVTLLILGLMFGYTASALVSVLLYFSLAEQVQAYISWTFGSFAGVTWSQMKVFAPTVVVGVGIALASVKPLNALLLGEAYARSMGLTVQRARLLILTSAAILAGATTAFCGPIIFLGVAVPHLCRSIFNTSDHRVVVPAAILMGGIIALVADLVAQMPGSQTILPLNAITSLIGAPVVIWVILRQQNLKASLGL